MHFFPRIRLVPSDHALASCMLEVMPGASGWLTATDWSTVKDALLTSPKMAITQSPIARNRHIQCLPNTKMQFSPTGIPNHITKP